MTPEEFLKKWETCIPKLALDEFIIDIRRLVNKAAGESDILFDDNDDNF